MVWQLNITTYNIHKGMSMFNRRSMLAALKKALNTLDADIVFLQEVRGAQRARQKQLNLLTNTPQHMFLGDNYPYCIYGCNAKYRHGHHGNALLSRYPINYWYNLDISLNRLEQRGVLHAQIAIDGWQESLHALCIHLNLRANDRRQQLNTLICYANSTIPSHAPLIIAGDFNDWREEASDLLKQRLNVYEVFQHVQGEVASSFPAHWPILPLDRIYIRRLNVLTVNLHHGAPWSNLSDHIPLSASLHRL